ncbi:MAG TPA: alpha/beta hydrolase [Gaiellales bacterium]|nr:alpha/beta hydrolase [Gaiellales bacterium]
MSRFHILVWGAGDLPPVVCLHRARGHARRFERVARMITDERRVIAYDLRGHGRSPWSGPHTLAQHAADLEEVLESVGAGQVVLLGDGFGSRVALEYTAVHGGRVTALALLDPPLRPHPEHMRELAATERRSKIYANADAAIAEWPGYAGLHHTPRALIEEDVAEHLVVDQDGRLRFRYSHDAAAAALEVMAEPAEGLKEIVCPVLIVRGEISDMLTVADTEWAAGELRRCRLEVVPGGHVPLWDALAESGALVRSFVAAQRARA